MKKIRVVLYARVSTKEQTREGTIQTQIDRLIKALALHKDREQIGIFKDEAESGSTDPFMRKNFPKILEMAKNREFDELWVSSRDRLARDVDMAGYVRIILQQSGVNTISLDDTGHKVYDKLKDLLSEEELEKYKERQKEGVKRAIREGRTLQRPPFGYVSEGKKMIVDERRRELIKAIFHDFDDEDMSIAKIAFKYKLKPSLIQRIRLNPIYSTGEVKWKGKTIYKVEPIV
jgi:DNA invertase Pin-like site-specific DNA recombinase